MWTLLKNHGLQKQGSLDKKTTAFGTPVTCPQSCYAVAFGMQNVKKTVTSDGIGTSRDQLESCSELHSMEMEYTAFALCSGMGIQVELKNEDM